jgi:hypothetical protein
MQREEGGAKGGKAVFMGRREKQRSPHSGAYPNRAAAKPGGPDTAHQSYTRKRVLGVSTAEFGRLRRCFTRSEHALGADDYILHRV